ncbi:hypothetical protein EB118_03395 [bacterium]|nr:hypothetical protein [bacterium]
MFLYYYLCVLEDYIKELEADLKIDELYLKDYTLRLPGIKHKWAGRCIRHKLELVDLKSRKDKLKKALKEKVLENSAVKPSLPVLDKIVDSSDEIKEYDKKIHEIELVVELLEKSEKTLSSASYDLKNLIDIIKLETT